MTKYTERLGTPLLFHKFMNYVFLPLSFLFAMERLIVEHALLFSGNWITTIDACSVFATLLLTALAFVGLLQWKSFGWYGLMILQAVQFLFSLVTLVIYALYLPDQINAVAVQAAGIALRGVLVGIYYLKRKPLFFPVRDTAGAGSGL
ncbi:hypothetical protein [Vermiculatibacterium agrestimuris]|uniref:hypothetical protein n=1 Tax=Vermiculatibacterium agrestimuris TaxID=2941519 RepID=UPI00203B0756|nr:hypothetical protein [Vermiculatibacterium agrestimuris]